MIDVRTAITTATQFFTDLFGSNVTDLRLEEVEFDGESQPNEWRVTLGFMRSDQDQNTLRSLGVRIPREYKVVRVNAANGEVLSVKIRQLVPEAG